jgi:hypothetical protein
LVIWFGHGISGQDLIGIHIVAQNNHFPFIGFISVLLFGHRNLPASAEAAAVAGEAK